MRTTSAPARKRRHKKIFRLAKGYRWGRSNVYRLAKDAVSHAGRHAYAHRRTRKRDFRRLWITRISAALRARGQKYSVFACAALEKKIALNRKVLADLAVREPKSFDAVVQVAMGG